MTGAVVSAGVVGGIAERAVAEEVVGRTVVDA